MKLIIYLPAYNEENKIQEVIENLPRELENINQIQTLVIDDGSEDATAKLALLSGAKVVSHGRNRGVGAAFHTAVLFALENGADILVGIDADGQFDSKDIPELIEPIINGRADMVIGNRFMLGKPEYMPSSKYWGNQKVAQLISYISGQHYQDVSCGFRAMCRESLYRLNIFAEFTYTHETILSLVLQGFRVSEHPVQIKYYPNRKSRVAGSLFRYAIQTSGIIFRVLLDYQPIRIFGTIGIFSLIVGIGFVLFLMGYFFLTDSFTPYKSTGFIGLGFIIFGLLVFLIALIADMLNSIRLNQDRILYEFKKIRYGK